MRQIQKRKNHKGKINLSNIDIREVLDDIGIFYTESGKNVSSGWIGTTCCFCGDESNHLGICLSSPVISCFKCGKTGNYLTYLIEELQSFDKALDILQKHTSRELRQFEGSIKERAIKVELPKEANRIISPYHAGYLQNRGFNPIELTEKYNLHFTGPIGKWKNRIIVPVMRNYRLLTYTSIDISENAVIRYLHLSEEESSIHVKELLFGIEYTNKTVCCVVEGLFDMLRIGDGAVCSFGTKVTSEQKRLLSRFRKVIIAFDGDEAGRTAGEKLANDLSVFTDVEILDLPDGKDPDTLSKTDIKFIQRKINGK